MTPERLGPYVLQGELGRGGMGAVYQAVHAETGETVAVKILPLEMGHDRAFRHRFEHEIAALATLEHPNIVKFYEHGESNGLMYYAMEYVPGRSLDRVLQKDRRLGWERVVDVGIQTCRALKHAHDHGIIHRDLKLANLLMTEEEQIKLTDFGIAKVFSGTALTATGGIIGTAEYMSPEQAEGRPITRRSDLYSLGIVLYSLATGRLPFSGKTMIEVLNKQRYGQCDDPRAIVPDLPVWLDELIRELLSKEPEKRPADALVAARRLELVRRKVELQSGLDSEASDFNRPVLGETAVGTAAPGGLGSDSFGLAPPTTELPGFTPPTGRRASAPTQRGGSVEGTHSGREALSPATLMKRLLHEQLKELDEPGVIGRFFQNTWVLIGLLGLVLGVMWWKWNTRPLGPEQLYERGMALARSESPEDQIQAKQKYFDVLERKFPESLYAAKARLKSEELGPVEQGSVGRLFARIRLAQPLRPSDPPPSAAERSFLAANQLYAAGKVRSARDQLAALVTVFEGVPAETVWVSEARKQIAAFDRQLAKAADDSGGVDAAFRHAQALADQGKATEARAIWKGIETLYHDDPAGRAWVERARKSLDASTRAERPGA